MAVNQDMYDTLSQYFNDSPPELDTLLQGALNQYFSANSIDIDFSTNNSFETSSLSVLSRYFTDNPISVDLTDTNNKIDGVKTVVDSVKTKVDTNLDVKISSVGSVDLTDTNNKIDGVKTVVDTINSVVGVLDSTGVTISAYVSSLSRGQSMLFYGNTSWDNSSFLDVPLDEMCLAQFRNNFASISSAISQGCDLSQVTYTIDGSALDLSTLDLSNVNYSIDSSTLDLTPISNSVVDVISQNVQDFIATTSLNGSSGALYFDGSDVLVDGDNRIYTVLGSQILTTIGGQADYFYVLQDSQGRKMLTVQDNLSLSVEAE